MRHRETLAVIVQRNWPLLLCRFCAFLLTIFLAGCEHSKTLLRIYNEDSVTIHDLVVHFPEEQVEFGDVAPKSFSPYHSVTHGVGPYASFTFTWNGKTVNQTVADFVGWKPIQGTAITYHAHFARGNSQPFLDITATVDR